MSREEEEERQRRELEEKERQEREQEREQEAGAVEGGPAVNAERVIEWITHHVGVVLTWNQEQLIRNHCEARKHGMVSTDPGREFAVALVDAFREEMDPRKVSPCELMGRELDHADYAQWAQGFTWKQAEGGYPPPGEAARIPDRVFMDDPAVLVSGGLRSIERLREENDG